MKVYKKAGIIFLILSLVILIIFLSLPYFFQNQLFELLETEGRKQLNAELSFDKEQSSLSFFPNFPHLTVTIKNLQIKGINEFASDTLLELSAASISFSTWQLIGTFEPQPRYISLNSPKVKLKRLKNGKNNWTIFKNIKDNEKKPDDSLLNGSDQKNFQTNLALKGWEIKNATVIFEDESSQTILEIKKLNHEVEGDFSENIFDLVTVLDIGQINWTQNNTRYLDKHQVNFKASLNINQEEKKHQLTNSSLSINQFKISSEGSLKIIDDLPHFDIQFSSPNQQFVSFLSVFFSESWIKNFQTTGEVSLTGFIKGVWDGTKQQYPLSHLHFQVKDASFQYAKMSKKIQGLNLDLLWSSQKEKGGNFQLKNLEAKIEKSEIKGNCSWKQNQIQGKLGLNIELEELVKVFPLVGLNLKGNLSMNAWAKGVLDKTSIPKLNIKTTLDDGFAKIILFPKALENVKFDLEISDSTQNYEDFNVHLKRFSFEVEDDSLFLNGRLLGYNNPKFDFTANGVLNFTNLMKVVPFLKEEFLGRVYLDVHSQGRIEQGSFSNINNQGQIRFENFKWKSPNFYQEIKIIDALILLQQQQAQIEEVLFFYGNNDLTFKGQITDYMDYLFFPKKGVLRANLSFTSRDFSFPLDEDPTFTDIGQTQIHLPQNCNWQISSSFDNLHFFQHNLEQVKGSFQFKEGVFSCSDFEFLENTQKQRIQFSYDSKPEKPVLDYKFFSN